MIIFPITSSGLNRFRIADLFCHLIFTFYYSYHFTAPSHFSSTFPSFFSLSGLVTFCWFCCWDFFFLLSTFITCQTCQARWRRLKSSVFSMYALFCYFFPPAGFSLVQGSYSPVLLHPLFSHTIAQKQPFLCSYCSYVGFFYYYYYFANIFRKVSGQG